MPGELPQTIVNLENVKSLGMPSVMLAIVCWGFWQTTGTLTTAYVKTLEEASKSYRSIAEDLKMERIARENADNKLDQILAALKNQ